MDLLALLFWGGPIIIALLSWFIWDKRYRGNRNSYPHLPEGYEKTDEVFIDPVNGKRQRVYYKAETGERLYVDEE
ncbi:MAG: hypothetical protein ACM3QW_06400 [Ignavibacteriales bacterium]